MTAAADTLARLQWQQRQHDIAYHADIWALPPARSLTHMTLHQTKYMGALAAVLVGSDAQAVRKILTDAFAITLATANILNQDLREIATGAATMVDLDALGCVLARTEKLGVNVFDHADVLRHYAMTCGKMAKACEAFDHAEDYPSRKILAECNADLCRMLVTLAAARNIDLHGAYQARMAAVEAKSVFNAQIEKTRTDKQAPSAATPRDPSVTRGTIHQHR